MPSLVSDAWSRGSHIAAVRAKYMASEWWHHHHCSAFTFFLSHWKNTCSLSQPLLSRLALLASRALPATQLAEAQRAVCMAGEEVHGSGSPEKNVLFTFSLHILRYYFVPRNSKGTTHKKKICTMEGMCVLCWRPGSWRSGPPGPQPPSSGEGSTGAPETDCGAEQGKGPEGHAPLSP